MFAFTGVLGEEQEALNKSSFCRFVLLRIGSERDLWIFGKELIRFSRDTSTWKRVEYLQT